MEQKSSPIVSRGAELAHRGLPFPRHAGPQGQLARYPLGRGYGRIASGRDVSRTNLPDEAIWSFPAPLTISAISMCKDGQDCLRTRIESARLV